MTSQDPNEWPGQVGPFPEPEAAVGAAQASRAAVALHRPAEGPPSVLSIERDYVQGE